MSSPLRTSQIRVITGAGLFGLSVLVGIFVLPNASQQRTQKQNAAQQAMRQLSAQHERLAELKAKDDRIGQNKQLLHNLLGSMPDQNVGMLQWELSRRIHELAQQNGVRLQALKYGAPTREGAKGTDLEILNVEFTASGIYQNLKPFMLGLENGAESKLPFAVSTAKLEESPDGATLNVTLRAFRRFRGSEEDVKEEGL